MADIRSIWNPDALVADWARAGQALDETNDLETSVILSLFTDRRAAADDPIPDGTADRRGWWADLDGDDIHAVPLVGSRLWLLDREKQTEETRQRAIVYASEALQWLVDNGVAERVLIEAEWTAPGFLGLRVVIVRGETRDLDLRFGWAWDAAREDVSAVESDPIPVEPPNTTSFDFVNDSYVVGGTSVTPHPPSA